MTQLYFTVREIANRYIDPITEQILQSLMQRFNLWEWFRLNVFINNKRMAVSADDDGQGNIRMGNNRCDIDVETHYNPSNQMWDRAMDYNTLANGTSKCWRKRHENIFVDAPAGVSLQEFTVPFGLTYNVKLTFKSYDGAQLALSRILSLCSGDVVNQTHDLVYSYPVELGLMGVFKRIYEARKTLNQTYSFFQYMNMMARCQTGFNVNKYDIGRPNPDFQYVIKKQQLGCLALLQCDQDEPDAVMQDDVADAWEVRFTYKLQAGRPDVLQLTLPLVVEQTPLPNSLFKKNPNQFDAELQGAFQNSTFDRVARRFTMDKTGDLFIIRFPEYDDFTVPPNVLAKFYHYNALMIGVMTIDPTTPTTLSLNELDSVELSQEVRDLLALHSADDIFGFEALFNITIYVNDIPLDRSLLDYDPTTLTVTFNVTQTLPVYRIVLSEAMTVKTLHPRWLDTVLQYRYYFPMTIFRSLKYLTDMGYYTVTSDDKLINIINLLAQRDNLYDVLRWMIDQGYADGRIYQFTQTATQLADYLTNTRARTDHQLTPTSMVIKLTLFDVFVQRLVDLKWITDDQRPQEYLKTPRGYAYGPGRGGFAEFNMPLRIMNCELTSQRS